MLTFIEQAFSCFHLSLLKARRCLISSVSNCWNAKNTDKQTLKEIFLGVLCSVAGLESLPRMGSVETYTGKLSGMDFEEADDGTEGRWLLEWVKKKPKN